MDSTWTLIASSRSTKLAPCPICSNTKSGCLVKTFQDSQGQPRRKVCCIRANAQTQLLGWVNVGQARKHEMGAWLREEGNAQTVPLYRLSTKPPELKPLHRMVWDYASCILQGRFPKKLAEAAIWDTSYCRYLTEENIRSIENHIHHQRQNGVYCDASIIQSGLFRQNPGLIGHRWLLTIPPGRILGIHDLQGKLVGIRANPETPIKVKVSGQKSKFLKYLQPKGISLHPYLPKTSREKLNQLWEKGTPYILVITEGEDTTESPAQNITTLAGMPVVFVGLPGVDGWMDGKGKLHPILYKVVQHCAHLVLAFDSDVMTKLEVRQAMLRLGQAVMAELEGRVIPLKANWSILNALPELKLEKYGLDDLLGELVRQGKDPAPVFEQLLSPQSARMLRRCWQRGSTPWTGSIPSLPSVHEAYESTEQAIKDWLAAGVEQPKHQPRCVIASTPGVGKTEALTRALFQRMQQWQCSSEARTAEQLQREILALQARKGAASQTEKYALLEQLKQKRTELAHLYQETLGGPLLVLCPNREALRQTQARLNKLNSHAPLPWLAIRTGREFPNPNQPDREQMGAASLVCAHHEPVSQVGTQRHSPSALACTHCFWGQEGRCGFLDSIQLAHLTPVVLATADAVLNASNELGHFSQVVIDEGLPHHLYEQLEIGQHLPQLLSNLRWGMESGLWNEVYDTASLRQLLGVLGEIETARTRYTQATPEELLRQGNQVTAWMEHDRVRGWLESLEQLPLKPQRWDLDKLELVPAAHYPWERPRYTKGTEGQFLHEESYGEEQQLAFESIPLRATDALLEELYQAILRQLPGTNLTFEQPKSGDFTHVAIHLYRPHSHLIDLLSKGRLLNLDATPNEALLNAFFPDIQIERYDAALNVEIFQVLTGPMGKASNTQLKSLIPALEILNKQGPVLLMTHKVGVDYLESQPHPLPPLVTVRGADGQTHAAGWFGYHDRAFDDPQMKTARTLVLAGGYTPNIGHLERLARMLERLLAVKKRSFPSAESQPYRIHSYGPQGYELVEACNNPLLDALIYQERTAALLQAINRPRPARSKQKLRVILYRADPVPPPYNQYVQVLGSLEEFFSVSLPMKNKANAARLLAAWEKHGEVILSYFVEHWALPPAHEVQRLVGGSRGKKGSITRAIAWFSAQVLPQLQQHQPITRDHPAFQEALVTAAKEYFQVTPAIPPTPMEDEVMECYWISRYRLGNTAERLITWLCTRNLSSTLQAALEEIQPIQEVFAALRIYGRKSTPAWQQLQGRDRP